MTTTSLCPRYIDGRGSGIGRILNSYPEFVQKPEFFSTEHYFLVVLPNRSVAELAQTSIDLMETQLTMKNDVSDQDWELICFRDVLLKAHGKGLRKRPLERILLLFERYRYAYHFN